MPNIIDYYLYNILDRFRSRNHGGRQFTNMASACSRLLAEGIAFGSFLRKLIVV